MAKQSTIGKLRQIADIEFLPETDEYKTLHKAANQLGFLRHLIDSIDSLNDLIYTWNHTTPKMMEDEL